jgi:hypothetical protein
LLRWSLRIEKDEPLWDTADPWTGVVRKELSVVMFVAVIASAGLAAAVSDAVTSSTKGSSSIVEGRLETTIERRVNLRFV